MKRWLIILVCMVITGCAPKTTIHSDEKLLSLVSKPSAPVVEQSQEDLSLIGDPTAYQKVKAKTTPSTPVMGQSQEEVLSAIGRPTHIAYQELKDDGTEIEVWEYEYVAEEYPIGGQRYIKVGIFRFYFKNKKLIKFEKCKPEDKINLP